MDNHAKIVSHKTGSLPGTPVYIGSKTPSPTVFILHQYNETDYHKNTFTDIDTLIDAIEKSDYHCWLDIVGLADANAITKVLTALHVHQLAIEDVLNTFQRPKVELFNAFCLIVFKLIHLQKEDDRVVVDQVSFLLKEKLLVSVREVDMQEFNKCYERFNRSNNHLRTSSADYLAYLLIDTIVDNYFRVTERVEHHLEAFEETLTEDTRALSLTDLYELKRKITFLQKNLNPLRDITRNLMYESGNIIKKEHLFYFRDLSDHCMRLIETVEVQREMSNSILDIYLSIASNKMNEAMKVLTIFASIFIPLTFIAGIYGMNFSYMPELQYKYSYFIVLGMMAFIAIGLSIFFKKKKWF